MATYDAKRLRQMRKDGRLPAMLPPDPEGMNDERAEWAEAAIAAFIATNRTDREDALADLLCDLRHWCDRKGFDFDHELARAQMHYDEETR